MQNTKKIVSFRIIAISMILCIVLAGGGIVIANKFFTKDNLVKAADTYYKNDVTRSSIYHGSGYACTSTARLIIKYDNAYFNSAYINYTIDIQTLNSTYKIYSILLSGSFTLNPLGYSWKSSFTSVTLNLRFGAASCDGGTISQAESNALSASASSYTFTRSGNTFSCSDLNNSKYEFLYDYVHSKVVSQYRVVYIDATPISSSVVDIMSYTLTFDYNGGNVLTTSKNITYKTSVGTLPAPTRTNYIFSGWYIGSTRITETTTWTYTSNQTAVAKWTFDGYTLSYSIEGGGGSVVGAANEYPKNASVTVTASANDGFEFDYWLLNGSKLTANPLNFTITQNSTLVAYFKEKPTVNVSIQDEISCNIIKNIGEDALIVIKPASGYYVHSFVLDGVTFLAEYYHANIYGAGEAHIIHYTLRDSSNSFSMYFDELFGTSNLNIILTNSQPTYKNPPSGGATIKGVATLATIGGEARVNGFDTENENSLVHVSAISYAGFTFVGWTASNDVDLSGYGMTADIPYNLINGAVLVANFVSTNSGNTNEDLDNKLIDIV